MKLQFFLDKFSTFFCFLEISKLCNCLVKIESMWTYEWQLPKKTNFWTYEIVWITFFLDFLLLHKLELMKLLGYFFLNGRFLKTLKLRNKWSIWINCFKFFFVFFFGFLQLRNYLENIFCHCEHLDGSLPKTTRLWNYENIWIFF